MLKEFHIDTAYEVENETWILGRTGESTSLSVGDVFTRAAYYVPMTTFEEYIRPRLCSFDCKVNVKILDMESYNKKLTKIGENTVVLLKVELELDTTVSVAVLQSLKFNVLIAESCE